MQSPKSKKVKKSEILSISRKSILEKMQSNFNSLKSVKNRDEEEEEEIEKLEGEFLSPFECGFCLHKFSSVEKLESHVTKMHKTETPGVNFSNI